MALGVCVVLKQMALLREMYRDLYARNKVVVWVVLLLSLIVVVFFRGKTQKEPTVAHQPPDFIYTIF